MDELEHDFDDHPSLSASLEDFEEHQQPHLSPLLDLPSQHSGFRSEPEDSEIDDKSSSSAPWSPPGFRPQHPPQHQHNHYHQHRQQGENRGVAGSWFRHDPYGTTNRLDLPPELRPSKSPSRSRQTSPDYEDAVDMEDVTIAANVPLPSGTDSPLKERSPEPNPPGMKLDEALAKTEPVIPKNDHENCTEFPL